MDVNRIHKTRIYLIAAKAYGIVRTYHESTDSFIKLTSNKRFLCELSQENVKVPQLTASGTERSAWEAGTETN